MREENYRDLRFYDGDLRPVFDLVVKDYKLGDFISSKKIEMGYEDNNHILETTSGKYFLKIFGGYRDLEECKRYIGIIEKALAAGVNHPKMYQSNQRSLFRIDELNLNMALFELVDGTTFYESGLTPTEEDAKRVIKEATKIDKISDKPSLVYDEWAITGAVSEYEIAKPHLSDKEKKIIGPLVKKFKEINVKGLPHTFVHGDITTTNTMKTVNGDIYIIDFAVTNYYPRIMELALLKCNLLQSFDLDFIVSEYEKEIKLTDLEHKELPLFVNLAHAMHVIGASKEKFVHENTSEENEYWLREGKEGLSIK